MTKNELRVLACNALYTLSSGMSSVFMNVFLYAYTGSLTVMCLYTCIRIAMFPICFTIAGKLARKCNYGLTVSIGLCFLICQLVFVLGFNEQIAIHHSLVYIVALFYGIGEGFYWLSINTLNQLVTTPETRNRYIGLSGIFNNIMNVAAPLCATFIIDCSISDMNGYINIFKVVLGLFILIALIGLSINEKGNPIPFSVLKVLRFQNDPQWRYVLISYTIYGFRDSLTLALAGLLVYNATSSSGSLYGKLLAVFAVITIISYAIVSKTMVRENRMKFYTIGAILLSSATIVLVLCPNIYGAIYYGVVNGIATAMYSNPFTIITMNALNDYAHSENLVGRVIAKETYLSIARCLGMLFIVVCYYIFKDAYLIISVIILSLSPVVLVIYGNIYHHKRDALKRG